MTIEHCDEIRDPETVEQPQRRNFLKCSAGSIASVSFASLTAGCGSSNDLPTYPIDPNVKTTAERMMSFPMNLTALGLADLDKVSQYAALGYGKWTMVDVGLPIPPRYDIMPDPYTNPTPARLAKFVNFFSISDIHVTDKESPNQLIYFQQENVTNAGNNTSIYSPVMMYTTHVLDAAMQTVNALHKKNPIDFGLSLGDCCNSTQYNELRWYLDVIDGKPITPSSGANLGADTIDYQKPYQAVGLDKSIPLYQAMGNHDHFYLGSFPVDGDPTLGIRNAYTSDTVWSLGQILTPNPSPSTFPALFDMENMKAKPAYYMGVIDGSTPYGTISKSGAVTDPAYSAGPPKVAADPNRRSLLRTEWIQEFFNTTTSPVGHGFNLVDRGNPNYTGPGFACYSFVPKANLPLKVIVLDDTQSETDGSHDIHGHGYLDAARWAWLQAELAAGQEANQLMIVAAHIPICVTQIGGETEWWLNDANTKPSAVNAVSITDLVLTLQSAPNLLMWVAGHRHLNVIKALKAIDKTKPEQGFWQVETPSLRDFPQQLRTFEIYLNSDYTISIVTVNVDPSVAAGSPAATSRGYAIAAQQITQNNLLVNNPNATTVGGSLPVPTMDPTRLHDGTTDLSIQFSNLANSGVPYNASYNAELFKQLSPRMVNALKALYPPKA